MSLDAPPTNRPAFDAVDPATARRSVLAEAALIAEMLARNDVRLRFPQTERPDVSIVIVSREARHLLALTLYRLQAQAALARAAFEVILVDNASGPETRALFARLDGVTLIENDGNIGFGPACNAGAARAGGRFLLFLNPDIEMMPGALDAMVETFAAYPEAGIVGGRLVFPGGVLQEAGARFRDDAGLTHPMGRGLPDPFAPEHAALRDVGYVSGALLMIERALFDELGGFDDLFAPAYFEDTDLCLRCHQAGRRVLYQPRASAIHYENATSERRADVEALLNRNRALFLDRHRRWLFETGPQHRNFTARDHDPWRLRVLYIDDYIPHQDMGAGLPRANAILNAMARLGYDVTFLPILASDTDESRRYRDIDERVELLTNFGEEGLARLIAERREGYDVLWVSRSQNIRMVMKVFDAAGVHPRAFAASRIIFDSEALFALRDFLTEAFGRSEAIAADLARAARAEARPFALADYVVCVSEAEARVLSHYAACNVAVLGHALTVPEGSPPFRARQHFVFVGSLAMEGQPNVDSIDWFLDAVWPVLRARLPEAQFTLIGAVAPSIRERFSIEGVQVLGRVDAIAPLLDAARVCIAPTRFAAGIPHKVHESVSHGLPTLVTPILAEQVGWPDGTGILARDWRDPHAFIEALVRLHEDETLWTSVQAAGLERIRAECDPAAYAARIRDLCEARVVA